MPESKASAPARSPVQRERAVVTGLIALQLVLWLGFAVHRSPRFPGSTAGVVVGIAAAILMLVPSLLYVAVKRVPSLKQCIAARLPLQRLLAWHVYGGIIGAIVAIVHTGHRFESSLGIALTGAVFAVILTGYIGRHFLALVTTDLKDKQRMLGPLVSSYNQLAGTIAAQPARTGTVDGGTSRWSWLKLGRTPFAFSGDESLTLEHRAVALAGSIADLEYVIRSDALLKRRFAVWLVAHVAASIALYLFLGLHVWASLHFSLRWLP